MKAFIQYIKDALDSQASPSFGRISAAVTLFFILVWGSYSVYKVGTIPNINYEWVALVGLLLGIEIGKEAYVKGKEAITKNVSDNTN